MLSPPAAHRILLARNETFKVQLQRGKKCLYVSLNSSGHGEGGHMHSYCETLCSARFIVTRQLDERGVLMEHKGVVCFIYCSFRFYKLLFWVCSTHLKWKNQERWLNVEMFHSFSFFPPSHRMKTFKKHKISMFTLWSVRQMAPGVTQTALRKNWRQQI